MLNNESRNKLQEVLETRYENKEDFKILNNGFLSKRAISGTLYKLVEKEIGEIRVVKSVFYDTPHYWNGFRLSVFFI